MGRRNECSKTFPRTAALGLMPFGNWPSLVPEGHRENSPVSTPGGAVQRPPSPGGTKEDQV